MNELPIITLNRIRHRNDNQIGIQFDYDKHLKEITKYSLKATWSASLSTWYIQNNPKNLKHIFSVFNKIAFLDSKAFFKKTPKKSKLYVKRVRVLTAENKTLLNSFYTYLKGKRYSISSIKTYTFFVADFIEYHNSRTIESLTKRDVELFVENSFVKRGYSISTHRQFVSAIKQFIIFYPETGISNLELTRPKKSIILPTVLSQEEMIAIIQCTKNLKHRAILALIYSAGLRISELINLKLTDFQIQRKQIHLRNGKGRKDRYVTLADSFLPLLNNYLSTYKPKIYFVEGFTGNVYSASSVRKFLTRSCKAANIYRRITPHTLRHSYATHLLESGVGLRHIQELLGHAKPETTMIYTHVARKDLLDIISPLDNAIKQLSKNHKLEQKFLLSRDN